MSTNIPYHLVTPRDWQAEALAFAARELGTPEGRRALIEANRYGALSDQIEALRRGLTAAHDAMLRARDELEATVSRPRGTDAQIERERELAAQAIDGSIALGYQGDDAPEHGHWLSAAHAAGARIASLEAERDAALAELERVRDGGEVARAASRSVGAAVRRTRHGRKAAMAAKGE